MFKKKKKFRHCLLVNKHIIFASGDNSQHMQSLIIILGAKTVHPAVLSVLTQGNVFWHPLICAKGCTHTGVLVWIRNVSLKSLSLHHPYFLCCDSHNGTVLHNKTEFFPIKLMCYINTPNYAAAANGCSVHGARLELDPHPRVCSVDADPQH